MKIFGSSNEPASSKNNGKKVAVSTNNDSKFAFKKNNDNDEIGRYGDNNMEYAKKSRKFKGQKLFKSQTLL